MKAAETTVQSRRQGVGSRLVAVRDRLWRWLPDDIDRRVRVIAWLSLVFQVVLIGFLGGIVLIERVENAVERGLGVAQLVAAEANEFG